MTFRELSQKVIIRFAELSIIYGLKFLRKELKESKEVNGVSIVTVDGLCVHWPVTRRLGAVHFHFGDSHI